MTRAKDDLHLVVPQRFFTHGQNAQGDRHVYASRTRFIPATPVAAFRDRLTWPLATAEAGGSAAPDRCASMSAPACAACGDRRDRPMCNLYAMTTSQQAIREFAGAMRDRTGNLPPFPAHLSRLCRPDRPQSAGRARTDHGALGHALAGLCAEGQEFRSGRHQCPQCRLAALATLARGRQPLHRALHQLFRERDVARRIEAAGLVRAATRRGRWRSSPASGPAGPRSGRSRKARRPTTSSPF